MSSGARAAEPATRLDEAGLEAWGRRIGESVSTPLVIALRGDLGAGKTTLARAIARACGVVGPIPSPTFNLLFRYPGMDDREVVHVDLYRLRGEDEVWALGWSELAAPNEVVLIEWPERAESLLPEPRWDVYLEEAADPGERQVRLERVGEAPPIPPPGSEAPG